MPQNWEILQNIFQSKKLFDLLIIIIVRKQIRKKLINRRKFININSETKYNFSKNNKIFIDGNLT